MSSKLKDSAASGDSDIAGRNVRLALILAGVAVLFFFSFFAVMSR